MGEQRDGTTRADDFDVDAILPDLTDLDPDLSDLLDLSGPPPEPLKMVGRPSWPRPAADEPSDANENGTNGANGSNGATGHGGDGTDRGAEPDTAEPVVEPVVQPVVQRGAVDPPPREANDPLPSWLRDPPPHAVDELAVPEFVAPVEDAPDFTDEHDVIGEWAAEDLEREATAPSALVEYDAEIPAAALDGPDFIDRAIDAHEMREGRRRPAEPDATQPLALSFDDLDRGFDSSEQPAATIAPEPPAPEVEPVQAVEAVEEIEPVEGTDTAPELAEIDPSQLAATDLWEHDAERDEAHDPGLVVPTIAPIPEPDTVEQPRMPVIPMGEPDGFAAQVAHAVGSSDDVIERPAASGVFAVRAEPSVAEVAAPVGPALFEEPDAVPVLDQLAPEPDESDEPAPATVDHGEASALAGPEAPAPTLTDPVLASQPTAAETSTGYALAATAPCVEPTPVTDLNLVAATWRRHVVKAATVVIAAGVVALLFITKPGFGDSGDPEPKRPTASTAAATPKIAGVDENTTLVAEAAMPLVDVYASPDGAQPTMSLEHPTEVGSTLVFLVTEQRGDWLHVLLPVAPNGSTGWIKAEQATLSKHEFKLVVSLSAHRLVLLDGGEEKFAANIAVGKRDTPMEGGDFYIKELLKPPNGETVYGNYAFGLSGFSTALENFTKGEGVTGIHGTDDASVIGTDVEDGSIRMSNEDMLELVGTLPLGTPVEIRP